MKTKRLPDIIIEVRGGNVSEIYTHFEQARVVVVDWDNLSVETMTTPVGDWKPLTINQMPADTMKAITGIG